MTNPEQSWGLSLQQIQETFRTSSELVCFIQSNDRFSQVNSKWKQVLGWEEEELLHQSYLSFVHPEDIEKSLEYKRHFIPVVGFYNRWRCKDGTYRYLSWISLASLGEDRPTFSTARDITLEFLLKKEQEERLQILSEQLRFNNDVANAIAEVTRLYLGPLASLEGDNLEGLVRHFVRLTGSKFGLLIQQPSQRSSILTEDLVSYDERTPLAISTSQLICIENLVARTLATQTSETTTIEDSDSSTVTTFLTFPLIRGTLVGLLVLGNQSQEFPSHLTQLLEPLVSLSAHLVSEIHLMRSQATINELEAAKKKAESESDCKSAFLAHMAHELRTPLSGVIGLLDLITESALPPKEVGYLQMSKESASSLLRILNDILDLSAIEAGRLRLEELEFNPRETAEELIHLFDVQAERKGIKLILQYHSTIPPTLVGDPSRWRQILYNLISNALKFTDQGSVIVSFYGSVNPTVPSLFTLSSTVEPQTYTFDATVQDSGIGMTRETASGLFNPFTQGDRSISRRFGGTGLGLYICKQLCTLMGGDIDATSTIDQGSTFHISVQFRLPEIKGPQKKVELDIVPTLPPLKVLVAEDNAVNQLILKQMLKKSGCTSIVMVWNGVEAVEAASSDSYDVILMDIQMPVMDGLEATKQIRMSSAVPIIGVTAHAMIGDHERFLSGGMNGCLVKPVHRRELVETILKYLSSWSAIPTERSMCSKRY